jgi:alkylated DNA repair dioxygenase AlkB
MKSKKYIAGGNTNAMQNILTKDGEVYMLPQFFSYEESDRLYQSLLTNVQWKHEPIKMFGKEIMQPRLTAWYGDEGMSYTYSGVTMQPLSWSDDLVFIKNRIEEETGYTFNSALLNLYRDGKDSVGWHRDNEKSLGINPIIASVSFGTARDFHLKHVTDRELKVKIPLTHGSLLLMQGKTQHNWLHSIQKEPKVRSGRINITFRTIVE